MRVWAQRSLPDLFMAELFSLMRRGGACENGCVEAHALIIEEAAAIARALRVGAVDSTHQVPSERRDYGLGVGGARLVWRANRFKSSTSRAGMPFCGRATSIAGLIRRQRSKVAVAIASRLGAVRFGRASGEWARRRTKSARFYTRSRHILLHLYGEVARVLPRKFIKRTHRAECAGW